jgi:hypothetical protein
MKILSICVAVLALNALISGCQKREPTRPAQPTVMDAKKPPPSSAAQPHRNTGIAGFGESVRKRHFDLP